MTAGTETGRGTPGEEPPFAKPCVVVFGWCAFDPDNLFAGTTVSRACLAEHLARCGKSVVMAYAGRPGEPGENRLRKWVAGRHEPRLSFADVPEWNASTRGVHYQRDRAHEFYRWLQDLEPRNGIETIVVPDTGGIAYYALLARQAGLAFGRTNVVVDASGPLRFERHRETRALESIEDLTADFMERRSIEMADRLIVPGRELLEWLESEKWRIPDQVVALPPFPFPTIEATGTPGGPIPRVRQIVFAAPVAERGNLRIVCETLPKLATDLISGAIEVVFWGPQGQVGLRDGAAYLRDRLKDSGISWRIEKDLSANGLLALASGRGSLFVFPAGPLAAPCVLGAALASGVAIACANPSALEDVAETPDALRCAFVARSDWEYRMVADGADSPGGVDIAASLSRWLQEGMPSPPRARMSTSDLRAAWTDAVGSVVAATRPSPKPSATPNPRVSVCIVTRNRPALLRQALASIEAQDYPNIELLLVDDGSDLPEAIGLAEELAARFAERKWRVLRQPHRFHTVGRNLAAAEAAGEYLLFMDDDNVAEPNEVSVLVRAALATAAHVLTCGRRIFSGENPPQATEPPDRMWVPLGNVPVIGLMQNCIGDMNFLVRRDTFLELGGFYTRSRGYAFDRDFFRRAWLAGKRIEVVPDLLYHYRLSPSSLSGTRKQRSEGLARDWYIARCYAEILPPEVRDLPGLVQALNRRAARLNQRDAAMGELRRRVASAERALATRHPIFAVVSAFLGRMRRSIAKRLRRRSPRPTKPPRAGTA